MENYQNHAHRCELLMLYGKQLKKLCPKKFKCDNRDECEGCDGHITPCREATKTAYSPDYVNVMIRSGAGLPPIKG